MEALSARVGSNVVGSTAVSTVPHARELLAGQQAGQCAGRERGAVIRCSIPKTPHPHIVSGVAREISTIKGKTGQSTDRRHRTDNRSGEVAGG